ncbi:hypothetical protein AB0H28_05845 [Micromonospora sp. NPDC050980]|uniref:hypothetical protein n=1 Tax=Micromonospora sp. NPDC050980 TaxID=3155161 RepID=UPI00340EB1C6
MISPHVAADPAARLRERLYAGIYLSPTRFANIERFVDAAGPYLHRTDGDDPVAALRRAASAARPDGPLADDDLATRWLLAEELRSIADAEVPAAVVPAEQALHDAVAPVRARLAALGLPLDDRPVSVVDRYPAPFGDVGLAAFVPGRDQARAAGTELAVHLRRDRLRPFHSVTILAHELVHTVTDRAGTPYGIKGLEEGLAELLGCCWAAAAVVPAPALRAILLHGRQGAGRAPLWTVYGDHLRQAALLYREYGLTGLAALVTAGRERIREVEVAVLTGRHRDLDLPRGGWDESTARLLDGLTGGSLPSYVLAPLDLLLADHVQDGRTLAEVCALADVPPAVGVPRLGATAAATALFRVDGEVVHDSIVERYHTVRRLGGQPVLRWLPPPA